jgi:hypothetical protein
VKRLPFLLASLALPGLGACGYGIDDISASEVPDHPTFETNVRPLLHDHCTLCHGVPAKRGAPDDVRLDQYDDDDHGRSGARAMAGAILEKVKEDEMPPAAAWGDGIGPNGKKLLDRWLADGAPR